MIIALSQGKQTIVCDCHAHIAEGKSWHFKTDGISGYAQHSWGYNDKQGKRRTHTELLHRLIVGAKRGEIVDHANRDKLDNRCSNLSIVSFRQNIINRDMQKNNTSGYTGVQYRKARNKWMAIIGENKHYRRLGSFSTPEEANAAYLRAKGRINV